VLTNQLAEGYGKDSVGPKVVVQLAKRGVVTHFHAILSGQLTDGNNVLILVDLKV
jgi:hypothetical protein